MKEKSRSEKVIKNSFFGFLNQFIKLLFTFVSRTIFIKILGEQYLGVNGLYSNILTVLSLADMGLGNVMLFSLYKPVLECDEECITALLEYYKNLYRRITMIILTVGMLFVPFLKYVVNADLEYNKLVLYYVLNLLNSAVSYVAIYKSALINADQKNYIVSNIQTVVTILQNIGQAVLLLIIRSYTLYLCVQVICTLLTNIGISLKADKLYPFLKNGIKKENCVDKGSIIKNLKSTFLYRIGTVIINYTDNILISVIVGTVYVGYYSNYSMLVSVIMRFLSIITQVLISGLGNLNADNDKEKSYKIFKELVFFYQWVSSVCAIGMLLVLNDFVTIWLGKEYLLSLDTIAAIAFHFYIGNVTSPIWMYRETCGMFSQIKYVMLITAGINIILSIILGQYFGIAGIIAATPLSRVLTVVWFEPRLLFKEIFQRNVWEYWRQQGWLLINLTFSGFICRVVCKCIGNGFWEICIKAVIVAVITTVIFFALNRNIVLCVWYDYKKIRCVKQ